MKCPMCKGEIQDTDRYEKDETSDSDNYKAPCDTCKHRESDTDGNTTWININGIELLMPCAFCTHSFPAITTQH